MANDNEIPIEITADTKSAEKSLESFHASASKTLLNLSVIVTGVNQAFELMGKAIKLVITPFEKAIKEASDAETEIAKLNFAIAATGEFTKEASDNFLDFAGNLQKTTTFSDDAAIQALTLAKNFGLTNEKAKDLVGTAANLAAQTGDTLPGATERLLNSLNGQSKALKDLGPEYKQLTEAQSRAGEGVAKVKEQFDGAATSLTRTFSGAVSQAKNNFNDIFKEFGKGIIQNETLIKSINIVSDAFSTLADGFKNNKNAVSDFVTSSVKLLSLFLKISIDVITYVGEGYLNLAADISHGINKIKAVFEGSFTSMIGFSKVAEEANKKTDFEKVANSSSSALYNLRKTTDSVADSILNLNVQTTDSTRKFQDQSDAAKKAKKDFLDNREAGLKFLSELEKSSATEIEKVYIKQAESLKGLEEQRGITAKESAKARLLIEKAFIKEKSDIEKKDRKEAQAAIDKFNEDFAKDLEDRRKVIEDAFKNPIKAFIEFDSSGKDPQKVGIAIGAGIASSILEGAKGAQKLLSAAIGSAVEGFAPGFGAAASQIFDQLATLGPDGVKAMVKEFVEAIPTIIRNVAEAAPAFVDALVAELVDNGGAAKIAEAIIDAFITKGGAAKVGISIARAFSGEAIIKDLGKRIGADIYLSLRALLQGIGALIGGPIATSVIAGFQLSGPAIQKSITDGFSSGINQITNALSNAGTLLSNPLSRTLDRINDGLGSLLSNGLSRVFDRIRDVGEELANSIKDAISSVGGSIGGGNGGFIGQAGRALGFASGGIVPPGYPNDSFPAPRLSSGELVIPKDIVGQLSSFLSNPQSNSSNDVQTALLAKIAAALGQPMTVESTVEVSGQALADIILKLSRNNARLAA